jgi:hypothetical protein
VSLLEALDLTEYQADPLQAAVDRAVALVGAFICPGVPGVLEEKARTVTLRLADEPRAAFVPAQGTRRVSARRLGAWPVTALTSVTVDGVDVTSECSFNRFSVTRASGFSAASEIVVAFKTGYTTLPTDLRTVILQLADTLTKNPDGVKSERVGDVSTEYALPASPSGLPDWAATALDPYRLVSL